MQYQVIRVQKQENINSNLTKADLLARSTYDNRLITNEEVTVSLPKQIRAGANYFKSIRCNLNAVVRELGLPQLFMTFLLLRKTIQI